MLYNLYRLKARKKRAFTLAEVLITLGIIGIVAAMTMPAIAVKIRNRTLKAQFNKTYSELNQAAKLFEESEGVSVHDYDTISNVSGLTNSDAVLKKYMNYFKGTSKPTSGNWRRFDPAHNITRRNLNGVAITSYPCDESDVRIDISGRLFATDNSAGYEKIPVGPKICVDINGTSQPNRLGYDRFTFVFTEDNTVLPYTGTSWSNITNNLTDENKIKEYCSYTSSSPVLSCAYYAAKDKSPDGNGTYWGTFLK